MKHFKLLISIIIFSTIAPMHTITAKRISSRSKAQSRGVKTAPVAQKRGTSKSTPTKSISPEEIQPKSYAQALDTIKRMPANKVLFNNTFTQEFIDFIKSLNLSPLEAIALLEAGANLHTNWTNDAQTNKELLLSLRNNIQTVIQSQFLQAIRMNKPVMPIEQPRPVAIPKPIMPIEQPRPVAIPKPIMPIEQPRPVAIPKPVMPIEQPRPAAIPKPVMPIEQPRSVAIPKPVMPIEQPRSVAIPKPVMPIEQPRPVAIPKPVMPIEQPISVAIPKPVMPIEQPISVAIPKPIMPIEQPKPIVIPKPVMPIEQPKLVTTPKPVLPIEQPTVQPSPTEQPKPAITQPIPPSKPITQPSLMNKVPGDLLGKVKKLEGYDEIYVGAGVSAAGEPIFFAMEKLNAERNEVWKKYIDALYGYHLNTQVITKLRKLNNKCDDKAFLETLNNDPYTKKLMEQMCPQKKKFSALFGSEDGIGGGITGFDQMLHRYSDDGDVIYIVYASSQPITGPFKPKKEIDVSSFTLEDFETAYSDLIICVAVDMLKNLKLPVSTEHRGIFKNPFNEIRGGYKNIGVQLHAWAGTVEEQFFNKKYMTVFPTEHAAKLLHSSTKKGEMYLGTDKEPFPYDRYYKDEELKLIKEKFPPIQQELIGDAPTKSAGGIFESLHIFPLSSLSTYYTDQGKGQ